MATPPEVVVSASRCVPRWAVASFAAAYLAALTWVWLSASAAGEPELRRYLDEVAARPAPPLAPMPLPVAVDSPPLQMARDPFAP